MMVEWRRILEGLRGAKDGVLVTLVQVEGSSYRRPGARLLLSADGRYAGSISGGCLEAELMRRARWLLADRAVVQHYSTSFDDMAEIPFGLGCGGELDLLLETTGTPEAEALFHAARRVLAGECRRIVTWLPVDGCPLRRAVFADSARTDGITEPELLFASIGLSPDDLLHASRLHPDATDSRIFVERMEPPQRLVLLGAGDDAQPIVTFAAMMGWTTLVMDGHRSLARKERFPGAEQVQVLDRGHAPELRSDDAVVLMTHSYEQDRALLATALVVGPKYLGLLGARHRSSLLVSETAAHLGWTVSACCERLHAPVGLDLGGDGAEAIALAIVSEIQACVQGRPGSSRRLSASEIAEQITRGGASGYPQAQCALDLP